MLEVRSSPRHGRGVFATARIPAGSLLEVCPALPLSPEDTDAITATDLSQYVFHWDSGRTGVAFGLVSMCNHGDPANAEVLTVDDPAVVELVATREIPRGAEVLIDYGPDHRIT